MITKIRYFSGAMLLIALLLCAASYGRAQRSDYQQLVQLNKRPRIDFNVYPLPGQNGKLKLTANFQFSNSFLAFKKLDQPKNGAKFYSGAQLTLEVFKSPSKNLRRKKQVDIEGLQSVGRAVWKDTAYAADYKETKSQTKGLNGSLQVNLKPGYYSYLVQLKRDEEGKSRGSRTRNIHLRPYRDQHRDNLLLVQKIDDKVHPSKLTLFNLGDKVIYGKNFYAFIHIPQSIQNNNYSIAINRINIDQRDTSQIKQVYQQKITPDQLMQNIMPELQTSDKSIELQLQKKQDGYNYALLEIPNKNFPDAVYRLTVKKQGESQPEVSDIFRSYWSDIPTSLLSLDMSIDMLRFITDKSTIKKIDSGSRQEREKKFRQFWKEKDPTPKTEYNELEAEYYNRIDYAYEHFGSQGNPGYDTDRGKIYINYGPPDHKERKYPPEGATTEIWQYKNRSFVFKATTGFGDYKLVSKKTNQ